MMQPYPFHNLTNNNNEKYQLSQKQIQFVFDINLSYVDQCQIRIKEYPDRVLYAKGAEKKETFNVYKHQVAIRLHSQHDQNNNKEFKNSITTCLNGLGKRKNNNNDLQNVEDIWNDLYVIGITKNNVNILDTEKKNQLQTNVIVHGDAQIYNNGKYTWFPGQHLVIKPPSPNLNHNIRFGDFPEHAFYPIVEPLQYNQGMIPNADNFIKYIHNNGNDGSIFDKLSLAPWVREFYNHLIQNDIVKGNIFRLENKDETKKQLFNEETNKYMMKRLYPLNDEDRKAHQMFGLFEQLHYQLYQKAIGKCCSYIPTGYMGSVVIIK